MNASVDTLQGLRALTSTLLARIDDAIKDMAPAADESLRSGKTPGAILRLLAKESPLGVSTITERLICAGRDVTYDAVAQACARHARTGRLRRCSGAMYELPKETDE